MIDRLFPFFSSFRAQLGDSFWMPPQRSTYAADVDEVFNLILWISVFFFALIVGLMVVFVVKYRAREGREPEPSPSHNIYLELIWSVIPLGLVMWIFYLGFTGYMKIYMPPQNAYEINVTAQKWKWLFTYPNGYVDEKLHVPVKKPVRLVMTSEDVIHSLAIPAFRMKMDVVPGRYHKIWFEATEAGMYPLYCAEYCGTQHSDMITDVVVHEPGQFEAWLEDASDFLSRMPPAEAGKRLYQVRGCAQCHNIDGTNNIGPTFKDAFGISRTMKDGSQVTVEENYIRESILEPQAKIVAGYQGVMPTYKGRLKDAEITAIIEFMKTLSGENAAEGAEKEQQ